MDKKVCPSLVKSLQEFVQWQNSAHPTIQNGLTVLKEAFCADAATFFVETTNPEKTDQIDFSTTLPCDIVRFRKTVKAAFHTHTSSHLDFFNLHEASSVFPYCLSYIPTQELNGGKAQLSLWNTVGFRLDEAQTVFLQMACAALTERYKAILQEDRTDTVLADALDAIDDGFILYDDNEKIIAFNEKQHELFPSIKDVIKIGGHYLDILEKQRKLGVLDIARTGGDAWVKMRRTQLRIHRHTEEQKFIDGRTIRQRNYQTRAGNTATIRTDITELARAHQEARESGDLFRALLVGAPIPLTIDIDGVFVYGNSYAHELIEVADGDLIGRSVSDFFALENSVEDTVHQLGEQKAQGYLEVDIKTDKGKKKTVSVTTAPIIYQGENAHFTSFQDITDAATARNALARSEKQNRDLLELIPDALVVQVDGQIVFVNKSAVKIFKAPDKASMINTPSVNLIPSEGRDQILQTRAYVSNGNLWSNKNSRHLRLNNTIFPSEMYAAQVLWNGQSGTMNIIRDNTNKHTNEHSLIQKELEMSVAQEIAHFGHWRIDLDKQTVSWSDELYRIHGLDPQTDYLDLDRAISFIVEKDRKKLTDKIIAATKTRKPQYHEANFQLDSGEIRCLSFVMRPEMEKNGQVKSVFGVSQDVTEHRVLEEKLRQSQKMEAVGQLTGGIAHDFNNLLAVIQGNTELLLDLTENLDDKTRKQLQAIMRATDRGADLTRSLLAYSRKQSLRPKLTKLDQQVGGMIKILRRTLGEFIHIGFSTDSDLQPCITDPGQVEAALLNMSLNARDAMPNGGTLSICTKNVVLDNANQEFDEDFIPGNYVMLSVTDTGVGIEARNLGKVFEPFFTTKETGKGTGLGLSMIYGFTKQSGGQISITSVLGSGTTVKIFLPQYDVSEGP